MNLSCLQSFRTNNFQRKFILTLMLWVWLASAVLVAGHNLQHAIEPSDHCALCLVQGSFDHAVPTSTLVLSGTSVDYPFHVLLTEAAISAFLIAPGIRDPPFSI